MVAKTRGRRRERGYVRRRGNSFQVLVYSGVDPLTGKDSYLTESTKDERQVEKIRTRLLAQVDQQRQATTKASLAYVLDSWLDVHEAEPTTLAGYRRAAETRIKPALGRVPIAKLTPRVLEQFYAELRRCRNRCDGRPYVEHRTSEPHDCDENDLSTRRRCQPHQCRPYAAATIRETHVIISGALSTAVRWGWLQSNPAEVTKKPKQPKPAPKPPTPKQAAQLVEAAMAQDESWGALVWLYMVTGARRGEILALRWHDVHLDTGMLEIRRNIVDGIEKDTKTHQIRRIALDNGTCELLRVHRKRYEEQIRAMDEAPREDAFVFSYQADHSRPCDPDGVSHRYKAMCTGLGIDSHLHALRHYSATELITAGVDVRTVAGRLGHGGGGTTTLRVYTAWVAESDKRAAELLAGSLRTVPDA
ncbi:tyrosine-type recombinase/integrase [Actinopolymorpha rutila]|uniref:Integrase n=1 Tax=Actinopolymorpha rutila TaxID=446787 RepID=A0A852Z772_9ACTN|nr:site-specific integrase [Actinopolymorpha rutila]NYH88223.1 integrase [Actinopolymorpha rutila]